MAATTPTLEEYLDAAFQASLDGTINSGITPLPFDETINPDGFGGMAFLTPDGNNLIVAFAGTDFKQAETDPEFLIPQVLADYQIYKGENPNAYADGVRFTQAAITMAHELNPNIDASHTFVAGHSLGGAIAAYVAAQLDLPGTTFAAPGLAPGDIPSDANPGNVTAYVEYGDPIGNYGSNPNFEGSFLYDSGIARFGTTTYVGDGSGIDELADRTALVIAGALYGGTDADRAASLLAFAGLAIEHHPLTDYATDLGYPSPPSASGADPSAAQLVSLIENAIGGAQPVGGAEGSVTVAFDPNVRFTGPATAVLSGTISDASLLSSLEIYAMSAATGGLVDLGSATIDPSGTWTLIDKVGIDTQSGLVALATDTDGARIADMARYTLTAGIKGERYKAAQNNYAADGTSTGQNLFGAHGGLYIGTAVTTNPDGSATVLQEGGRYFAKRQYYSTTDHYDAAGNLVEADRRYKDGSTTIQGFTGDQPLQSIQNDTFYPAGSGNTFVFTPGFGQDLVTAFKVKGVDHDAIGLSYTSFNGIADVLRHTQDSAAGAVITDHSTGDTITLSGVSKAELEHHRRDFTFA